MIVTDLPSTPTILSNFMTVHRAAKEKNANVQDHMVHIADSSACHLHPTDLAFFSRDVAQKIRDQKKNYVSSTLSTPHKRTMYLARNATQRPRNENTSMRPMPAVRNADYHARTRVLSMQCRYQARRPRLTCTHFLFFAAGLSAAAGSSASSAPGLPLLFR